MIEAYPLYWPEGRPRRNQWQRETARFGMSFARARDEVVRQVQMLAGRYPDPQLIISTNIALRRDGLPLANQRQPEDCGVAVYFNYKKRQVSFACDRWNKVEDNMQAIAKTIDALRGIARWGTGDMVEAAFKGFTALPAPEKHWGQVLGFPPGATIQAEEAEAAYRRRRAETHPDRGGSAADFDAVQRAWEAAQRAFGAMR